MKHPYLDSGKKRSPDTLMVTCPLTHVSIRSMKPRTPKCLEGVGLTRFPWLIRSTLTAVPLPVRPHDLTSVHPLDLVLPPVSQFVLFCTSFLKCDWHGSSAQL